MSRVHSGGAYKEVVGPPNAVEWKDSDLLKRLLEESPLIFLSSAVTLSITLTYLKEPADHTDPYPQSRWLQVTSGPPRVSLETDSGGLLWAASL